MTEEQKLSSSHSFHVKSVAGAYRLHILVREGKGQNRWGPSQPERGRKLREVPGNGGDGEERRQEEKHLALESGQNRLFLFV